MAATVSCVIPPRLEAEGWLTWSRILAQSPAPWLSPGLQELIAEDGIHPPLN